MKKLIFLFVVLTSLITNAEISDPRFEVITVQGQKLVLIPTATAQELQAVNASDISDEDKVKATQEIIAKLGELSPSDVSFCDVAGHTYQTVNKDHLEMTKQCNERLTDNSDMINEPIENGSVEEIRDMVSRVLALMITFSM